MKKIFFFAASMLVSMSIFAVTYKAPAETWTVGNTSALTAYGWNSVTKKGYASINDDWYTLCFYDLYKASSSKQKWTAQTGTGSTSVSWSANGIFQGIDYYHGDGKTATTNSSRIYAHRVTNMSAVSVYGSGAAEPRHIVFEVYVVGEATPVASAVTNTYKDTIITLNGFDNTKTYDVVVYGDNSGNCNLYEIAFSISGEEPVLDPKAVAPSFSLAAGTYYEPFKVGLASSKADHIYYSINGGSFQEYTDSIEIKDYNTYYIEAFSTLADAENSDTVAVEYIYELFIPRTHFDARESYSFANIQSGEINILDNSVATIGTYTLSGKEIPAVNYITRKTYDGTDDSTMCVSFAGRPGIKFIYKNKDSKNSIMKLAGDYLITDGSGFEVHIDSLCGLQPNDTVVFVVTAKGSKSPEFSNTYSSSCNMDGYEPDDPEDPNYTDGYVYTTDKARVDNDYCGWTNLVYIVKEGKKTIKLKETKAGYRLAKILIGAYRDGSTTGVENVSFEKKAIKRIENGQVVIIKADGRKFNLLGAEIK